MRCKKIKEDKPYKMSVRFSKNQYLHIIDMSECLGIKESEFIRMLVNKSITDLLKSENERKEDNEDSQRYIND